MKNKRLLIVLSLTVCTLLFIFSCDKEDAQSNLFLHAFFKTETTKIKAGDTIHFQDYSIGYPGSWEWAFEGGTPASSTEENPTVVYSAAGEYKVTLTVTANGKTSTKTQEKYIEVVNPDQLSQHLLASFPFSGSIADVGPNQIAAVNHGNVQVSGTDRHGNKNSAAVFDGSSLILLPDDNAINFGTNDFTISCWVKTTHTNKMMLWQESGSGGARDNQTWLRIGDNTTDRVIRFDTEDGGGGNIINYGDGSSTAVSDGEWHNVVCVREGGTTRLYVDGEMKEEMIKGSAKDVSNTGDFKIGGQEGPAGNYHTFFTGMIDDLSMYNKALNDEEVAALFLK